MGVYDEIRWDAELPEGHPAGQRLFQTKSLHRCLERYIVTKEGRLILPANAYELFESEAAGQTHQGVDVEFHGDMWLIAVNGEFREYVARFTHGSLEWIKPLNEVSEHIRELATYRHL